MKMATIDQQACPACTPLHSGDITAAHTCNGGWGPGFTPILTAAEWEAREEPKTETE